jgi:hypothetical protein
VAFAGKRWKEPWMPLFDNPFRSGKTEERVTSLNLETPKPQVPMDNSSSSTQIDPKLLAVAAPEVNRRAKEMLDAGNRPRALYLAVNGPNKLVSFKTVNPDYNVLLIFTSGHAAMDYLRTAKIGGGIHEFPFESLSAYMEMWKKAQLDSFVLDRCPRCPQFTIAQIDGCTEEKFKILWAIHRATRNFQAKRLIGAYLNSSNAAKNPGGKPSSPREMRNLLETLRDHIDYSVPYVHWLIALHAGVDGDQEARIASIRNLEAFGQDFVGKVPSDEPFVMENWAKSVVDAQIGLLTTFEMLPTNLQNPAKIEEKTIN